MTAVIERDADLAARLRTALHDDAVVLASVDQLDTHLQRHPGEHAVVLGPSVDDATAAALAEGYRISRPALGVIRIRTAVDSAVLAEALRSGMREVVSATDAPGLVQAVDRARAVANAFSRTVPAASEPARRGALVTVFSTKGGVGKSVVATNLAAALADQGRRTCIVDLDIACGDVAIMLQLVPQHTLADLAELRGEVDPSGIQSLLTEGPGGLSVLAAPVQLGAPVPPDRLGAVLETLKTMFDVVVVDTAGACDDHSLQALDRSEVLVLVGTLDIPALKSLKVATGTLDLLNIPRDRWRLLLNRADPKVGLTQAEMEETLGLQVTTSIPSSRDVLLAVNRGEVIVRARRGHQVSKALAAFAQQVGSETATRAPAAEGGASQQTGGRRLRRAKKVG